MGNEMKPCPWCGAAPVVIHRNVRRYARCSNVSDNAGLCGPAFHVEEAWNRRPGEDALRARAEAAEAALAAARSDLRTLAGLAATSDGVYGRLMSADFGVEGLTNADTDALTRAAINVESMDDADVAEVLCRALR